MNRKTTAGTAPAPGRNKRWYALWWLAVLGPVAGLLTLLLLAASSKDLPGTAELQNPRSDLATTVLFSDGTLMGQYYRENRIPVDFSKINPNVVHALVATEDERFFTHSGVDLRGTMRAAVFLGKRGGASTITQQLAKMLFHDVRQDFLGRVFQKFQEWIISARLEREYTKEEIIAMYLNRFDWINQAVGINSAARVYFNTTPDSLRVEQAAMLVGMCKNPALFNPLRRPEATLQRRMVVLNQMVKNGFLDRQAYDSLKVLPLGLDFQRVDHTEGPAPYLREALRSELQRLFSAKDPETGKLKIAKPDGSAYDIYTDGLKVYTTIDRRMQRFGEWAVREHLASELQPEFFKDLAKKKNRPFDFRVSPDEIKAIMASARMRSDRYKTLTGKLCPNCQRPAAYIVKEKLQGKSSYHCDPAKGGCDTWWPVLDKQGIEKQFDTPARMTVFTWHGEVDTLMTPNDSIRYYKSFLQSGLLSMDPHTGFVKAWVGGIDFKHFQYDHVAQARRQVGSTFKPFVYATAIREGMSPCTELPNQKTCFNMPAGQPDWCPQNSDNKYGGMVTLKFALANSMNTITAWIMKQYGPQSVTTLARHMGVKSPLEPVPSLCLGVADLTLEEMTGAFSTFANEGVYIRPMVYTRIEDKNGNTLLDMAPQTEEALDPTTSYIMLNMLKGVVDGAYNPSTGKTVGTGMRLRMGWGNRAKYGNIKFPTAGKTGTTQNNSDGWFIGITPDLVTGVWTGAEDRSVRFSRTDQGQGANMALPIYGYYMNKVYADSTIAISTGDFAKPEGMGEVDLNCFQRGGQGAGQNQGGQEEPTWE
ncbi:MAG: transglycosylase domain-containing protein [Flavobacteriales bacterium]|nr:transglycosylase domain-containing protein [Flavobacteriales bacterium]